MDAFEMTISVVVEGRFFTSSDDGIDDIDGRSVSPEL